MGDKQEKLIALIGTLVVVSDVLDAVCRLTATGFAVFAVVAGDRWLVGQVRNAANLGLSIGFELNGEAFAGLQARRAPVVIDNGAGTDDIFPLPGVRSGLLVPIFTRGGALLGALCALDRSAPAVDAAQNIDTLKLLGELIAFHIETALADDAQEHSSDEERDAEAQREHFISTLGHDLRNPLAALSAGTSLLRRIPLDEKATHIVTLMEGSVTRLLHLVENVLDFTRAQLGGGLPIYRRSEPTLEQTLAEVVESARSAWPDRKIETNFVIAEIVDCDGFRIGQLLANLLGSALSRGSRTAPVRVAAITGERHFELTIDNDGPPVRNVSTERLVFPSGGRDRREAQGLGLGLYIASEISEAHGGEINVVSTSEGTRLSFRMALR